MVSIVNLKTRITAGVVSALMVLALFPMPALASTVPLVNETFNPPKSLPYSITAQAATEGMAVIVAELDGTKDDASASLVLNGVELDKDPLEFHGKKLRTLSIRHRIGPAQPLEIKVDGNSGAKLRRLRVYFSEVQKNVVFGIVEPFDKFKTSLAKLASSTGHDFLTVSDVKQTIWKQGQGVAVLGQKGVQYMAIEPGGTATEAGFDFASFIASLVLAVLSIIFTGGSGLGLVLKLAVAAVTSTEIKEIEKAGHVVFNSTHIGGSSKKMKDEIDNQELAEVLSFGLRHRASTGLDYPGFNTDDDIKKAARRAPNLTFLLKRKGEHDGSEIRDIWKRRAASVLAGVGFSTDDSPDKRYRMLKVANQVTLPDDFAWMPASVANSDAQDGEWKDEQSQDEQDQSALETAKAARWAIGRAVLNRDVTALFGSGIMVDGCYYRRRTDGSAAFIVLPLNLGQAQLNLGLKGPDAKISQSVIQEDAVAPVSFEVASSPTNKKYQMVRLRATYNGEEIEDLDGVKTNIEEAWCQPGYMNDTVLPLTPEKVIATTGVIEGLPNILIRSLWAIPTDITATNVLEKTVRVKGSGSQLAVDFGVPTKSFQIVTITPTDFAGNPYAPPISAGSYEIYAGDTSNTTQMTKMGGVYSGSTTVTFSAPKRFVKLSVKNGTLWLAALLRKEGALLAQPAFQPGPLTFAMFSTSKKAKRAYVIKTPKTDSGESGSQNDSGSDDNGDDSSDPDDPDEESAADEADELAIDTSGSYLKVLTSQRAWMRWYLPDSLFTKDQMGMDFGMTFQLPKNKKGSYAGLRVGQKEFHPDGVQGVNVVAKVIDNNPQKVKIRFYIDREGDSKPDISIAEKDMTGISMKDPHTLRLKMAPSSPGASTTKYKIYLDNTLVLQGTAPHTPATLMHGGVGIVTKGTKGKILGAALERVSPTSI